MNWPIQKIIIREPAQCIYKKIAYGSGAFNQNATADTKNKPNCSSTDIFTCTNNEQVKTII